MRRLSISLKRGAVMIVDRLSIGDLKLAYVIVADKKVKYASGRARIAYIGTTKNGIATAHDHRRPQLKSLATPSTRRWS
jgi:hypothetical protein